MACSSRQATTTASAFGGRWEAKDPAGTLDISIRESTARIVYQTRRFEIGGQPPPHFECHAEGTLVDGRLTFRFDAPAPAGGASTCWGTWLDGEPPPGEYGVTYDAAKDRLQAIVIRADDGKSVTLEFDRPPRSAIEPDRPSRIVFWRSCPPGYVHDHWWQPCRALPPVPK